MAFGKSQVSTEAAEFKKYIGQGSFFVRAFNPTKEQLSKLYDREITKDQEYVGEITDNDGNKVQTAHVTFICQADPETNNGIEEFFTARFTIQNKVRTNRDNTKCQVIDEYGRTAWATQDDVKNHKIPTYEKDGVSHEFNISANYRPAFIGEEPLTMFLQNYLNIPSCQKYVNNEWVMVDNPSDSECRLDHIKDYFSGNFSELKDIVTLQPNNKFKAMIGVRTTDDGKQYSTLYTNYTLKNNSNNWAKIDADIQSKKNAGGLQTTEFDNNPLHEYSVKETNLNNSDAALPFSGTAPTSSPWDNA